MTPNAILYRRNSINTNLGIVLSIIGLLSGTCGGQATDPFRDQRQRLVRQEIIDAGVTNARVIDAMLNTKRHEFVPLGVRHQAYFDMALPIGEQQTISSPFIVAYMTEALDPRESDVVLEIGTGSGYQAAVLSPLVREVYTIEIVEALGKKAAQTLKRLKYDNVFVRVGDGFQGWPEKSPFDKIIVTCSPEKVPVPLVEQLREGGRMVIPVGERYQQTLYVYRKHQGQLEPVETRPTLFVPMTGKAETEREIQPDAANPQLINGSFETVVPPAKEESPIFTGWYYQRQADQVAADDAPDQRHFARLKNETPGRACRVLQGLALDGRHVRQIHVSGVVRFEQLQYGAEPNMRPKLLVTFYDEQRRDVGNQWLGPWSGSRDWHQVSGDFDVPPRAREAIFRIDLLGATGTLDVDHLQLRAVPR